MFAVHHRGTTNAHSALPIHNTHCFPRSYLGLSTYSAPAMRTLLKLILLFLAVAYLIFATVTFLWRKDDTPCRTVSIVIADSAQATLITRDAVEKMLHKSGHYPVGQSMKDINLLDLEQQIKKNPYISEVLCVKTPGNCVRIHVSQRLPLLRIMNEKGEDYYVDNKGVRMLAKGYEADVAIITGQADELYVRRHLLQLGMIMHDDEFWNSQIEQINVLPNGNVDLVMRVGNPLVHLGTPDKLNRKLRNLRAFYEKVLPKVGWHKYREISVAYENQVIGIK